MYLEKWTYMVFPIFHNSTFKLTDTVQKNQMTYNILM